MLERLLVRAESRQQSQPNNFMGKKHVIKTTEEELLKEQAKVEQASKKEVKTKAPTEKIRDGRVYIASSYNNTILTLTDPNGNVVGWSSAGSLGFKGSKKATPFAASKVAEAIAQVIQKLGIERLEILVRGIGGGRESAVRSLANKGFEIISLADRTPISHGGCRPKKARRV